MLLKLSTAFKVNVLHFFAWSGYFFRVYSAGQKNSRLLYFWCRLRKINSLKSKNSANCKTDNGCFQLLFEKIITALKSHLTCYDLNLNSQQNQSWGCLTVSYCIKRILNNFKTWLQLFTRIIRFQILTDCVTFKSCYKNLKQTKAAKSQLFWYIYCV